MSKIPAVVKVLLKILASANQLLIVTHPSPPKIQQQKNIRRTDRQTNQGNIIFLDGVEIN